MQRLFSILLILALLSGDLRLLAHDFWIQPKESRPAPGTLVPVQLFVGDHFLGDAMPRRPEKIEVFEVVGPDGQRKDVEGVPETDPAGYVRLVDPGIHTLVYRSKHSKIELEAAKFEAYLNEEGMESILKLRKERGESQKPAIEKYARSAKSLLQVGPDAKTGFDREIGLPLELIVEANPFSLGKERKLSFRLVREKKPVAGALVEALHRKVGAKEPTVIKLRTDAEGRVTFELNEGGFWLIASILMTPAPAVLEADYESHWASLTFEVPPPPAR